MSAMLDTYDTQMLDYHPHDLDVQMNTAVGSDSWVQEEATMEDEGFTLKSTFENVSIEIDMDDYDGISAENNVSKDLQSIYEDGSADIVDVEVYDTSRLHSPAAFPHPIPEETHELPSDPQVAVHNTDTDILPIVDKEQLDDRIGLSSDILNHLPTEHTAAVLAVDKAELVGFADTANIQVESNVLVEVDNHATSTLVPTSDDQRIDEANVPWTNSADQANSSSNDVHGNTEEKDADPAALTVGVHEDKETGHIQEHYPQDTGHQDPHEISEGVYIDPPPPVLLTIDIIGQYDINLFNEVLDVGTVENGEGEQDSNPSIVLLQDRPTLYYENLSNLFDALRQDTFLTNLTEISEGELILEAYDLRLVMPEDNCYVRGISLHDINSLHDSYGLSGPLRLRLRLESPRFIILYQRLQDRTAQLSVETHTNANTLNEETFQGESGQYPDGAGLGSTVKEASHDSNSGDGATNQDTLPEDGEQQHEFENCGDHEPVASNAPWSDDDSGLQYVGRAEPGIGTTAEATSTASEHKSTASKVTGAASDASVKDVGEVSNSEANQDHTTGETTPRLPSPSASSEKDEQETAATATGEEDGDFSRPDETEVPQIVDSAPLMEQSVLDANFSANDSHERSQFELHEHASSEEHDTTGETVDPDYLGSESWDAQFSEDGDLDATWDYETDKEDEERDGQDSTSVESSVTLSSNLSSKRSFHELDEDEDDSPSHSPGLKKPRME